MKNKRLAKILLAIVIVLPYLAILGLHLRHKAEMKDFIDKACFIVVSKEEMKLHLVDYNGCDLLNYDIACGRNYGNKDTLGDCKTPEGIFYINSIEDASEWGHDFGDGKGKIEGTYGNYFMRLEVPNFKAIGIHGTHKPESIGTRDSEGCIRLHNKDLDELVKHCRVGTPVVITTSRKDALKGVNADSLMREVMEHEALMKEQYNRAD